MISYWILFEKFPNQLPCSFPPCPTRPSTHIHSYISYSSFIAGICSEGGWSEDPELFFPDYIQYGIGTMGTGELASIISFGIVTYLAIIDTHEVKIKASKYQWLSEENKVE